MEKMTSPYRIEFCLKILITLLNCLCLAKQPPSRPIADLGSGSASQISCFVLSNDLGVKCIGQNLNGQLGQLSTRIVGDEGYFEMGDCLRTCALGANARPKQVVMGAVFTCALLDDGTVKCFGSCQTGTCGTGQTSGNIGDSPNTSPANVNAIRFNSSVVQLTAGESHVCALLQNGQVHCWGSGSEGQLGTGSIIDILPSPLTSSIDFGFNRSAREISAGYTHTCAVLNSISNANQTDLVCFGNCLFGKCGSGSSANIVERGENLVPIKLGTDINGSSRWALHVSAGAAHTCVSRGNTVLLHMH